MHYVDFVSFEEITVFYNISVLQNLVLNICVFTSTYSCKQVYQPQNLRSMTFKTPHLLCLNHFIPYCKVEAKSLKKITKYSIAV